MEENNKLSIFASEIKKVDSFIAILYEKLNIYGFLTPTNLTEENEKFIKYFKSGIEYNPIYEYKNNVSDNSHILSNICECKEILIRIINEDSGQYKLLAQIELSILEELENMIYLSNSIGRNDSNIGVYSKKIFGQPDEELVEKAKSILQNDHYDTTDSKDYNAQNCKALFENVLEELSLSNWTVTVNPVQSSKISVVPEKKEVHINGNVMFSQNDLKRLIVHEIGTHVLRSENGSNQPYQIFSLDIGRFLSTEEGLAAVNEEQNNVLDRRTFKIYAARVLAVSEGMSKSFYEVVNILSEYFTVEEAVYIVSRTKRGIRDTKEPSVFSKDYVYLDGYYKVKKYLEGNENNNLYTGIVGIDEMTKVNELIKFGILKKMKRFDINQIDVNTIISNLNKKDIDDDDGNRHF